MSDAPVIDGRKPASAYLVEAEPPVLRDRLSGSDGGLS